MISSLTNWTSPETAPRIRNTVAYYAAFVCLGMVSASLGPALPSLAAHTHSQLSDIGLLFPGRFLGFLLGSFLVGRLYDSLPGHFLMAGMLGLMAVMLVVVPLTPLLWILVLMMLLLGITQGAVDLGGNVLLVWVHQQKVGAFMNGLHFFFGVGAFLSPIIIAQALRLTADITWAYWVLAVLLIPAALWLRHLPSPQAHQAENTNQSGRTDYRLVAVIALLFLLATGAEVGFGGWIFTYGVETGLATETTAAYLTSAFFAAITLGRLLLIPLAARYKPSLILISNVAGALLSLGVILLWPKPSMGLWLGAFGMGLALASVSPTMFVFADRLVVMTGRVTTWFYAGISGGAIFTPWLAGQLLDSYGPQSVMYTLLVDLFLAGAILILLLLKFRPAALTEASD